MTCDFKKILESFNFPVFPPNAFCAMSFFCGYFSNSEFPKEKSYIIFLSIQKYYYENLSSEESEILNDIFSFYENNNDKDFNGKIIKFLETRLNIENCLTTKKQSITKMNADLDLIS
jgi:hypothetical protein